MIIYSINKDNDITDRDSIANIAMTGLALPVLSSPGMVVLPAGSDAKYT
jgi:hypothetical protein